MDEDFWIYSFIVVITLFFYFQQNGHVTTPTKSTEPTLSMKKLTEKLSSVTLRNKTQPLVENDAFEGIGDEDL